MTTTTERCRGHIADLMCVLRPDFDIAGCVAALRKLDLPLAAVVIAAVRYAQDPGNLTPAHLADFGNRAWDSDWHVPCRLHPEQRARRTTGECASCAADRIEDKSPRPVIEPQRPTSSEWLAVQRRFTGRTA